VWTCQFYISCDGRQSLVNIVTRYKPYGPGFEPRYRYDIFSSSHPTRPNVSPIHFPLQCDSFLWVKWHGVALTTRQPSSAAVKNE